jgi:hypothetical protein
MQVNHEIARNLRTLILTNRLGDEGVLSSGLGELTTGSDTALDIFNK